ncbi:PAS domain-containing protein [Flavivirga sp. 57AJ16]|uniref:PAS domain-containing protein n=1 Tax=Flavivirga sp. 57AJ16 TaxID=3025307 RepID=UPI00236531D1|nr:PAS domain-containing protein [Flavivirga sp. 57AJ16]MDD7886358.1 PAS domain-containing protein [Flavivirga sp. 57AJ16]
MDLLMNNMPDRIYFKDKASRFIRCNMAIAEIFGVSSPEELYGKTNFDFHDPVHAKAAFEDEQNIMRSSIPIINKLESFLK